MVVEPWLLAAGVLFLLGHVVILLFFYRLRQGAGRGSAPDTDATEAVSCQECGTENDGQFQFCRECAAELPGGLTTGDDGNAPDSRGML